MGMVMLSRTVEMGGIISAGTPCLLAGALLSSLQFCRRHVHFSMGLTGLMACMYVMSIMISLVWAPNLQASSFRALYHVIGFVLFISLLQQQGTLCNSTRFRFWSFTLTCAGLAIAADFLMLMSSLTLQGRLGEAFADRVTGGVMSLKWAGTNTIASTLLAPLCVAMLQPKRMGWLRKISGGAMLLAILATLSRNSLLCVLGSLLVYATLSRRTVATVRAAIGIGLVVAIGFFTVDADVYQMIIANRIDAANVESFNGRTDCWETTWDAIEKHWPCPVGFYGSLFTLGHSAHNVILIDMFEIGIWGLLAHMLLFASIATELWKGRSRRRLSGQSANDLNILLCGLICTFVNLQFEDPQYTQPYIICNWIFMGLCASASRLPMDMTTWDGSKTAASQSKTSPLPRRRSKPVVGARSIGGLQN